MSNADHARLVIGKASELKISFSAVSVIFGESAARFSAPEKAEAAMDIMIQLALQVESFTPEQHSAARFIAGQTRQATVEIFRVLTRTEEEIPMLRAALAERKRKKICSKNSAC